MLPSLSQVQEARCVVARCAVRTPLVRLNVSDTPCEIYLKLENLQPTGSFKIRGASNAMARLAPDVLARGVVTASAGNMGQGVAWRARELGVPCAVVVPETTSEAKIQGIKRLGASVHRVAFDDWWRAFESRVYPEVDATFIHAFDDLDVMAGNGTIAMEIMEDLPDADAIVIPWGGGGLTCGIASVTRQLKPSCRIFACEVATATPLAGSLAAGTPVKVNYVPSFIDGIGSKTVFANLFEPARKLLDGSLVAEVEEVASALRLLAERNRVIAEGAGACPVACALSGKAGGGKVVCVVSGGNIDFTALCSILTRTPPARSAAT